MPLNQQDLPYLIQGSNELDKTKLQNDAAMKLQQYLKGNIGADGSFTRGVEGREKEAEVGDAVNKQKGVNQTNVDTVNALNQGDLIHKGGSVKVGDIAVGGDPYAHMLGQGQKGEEQARHAAAAVYNQGSKKLGDELSAIQALHDALTQNDATSLGRARAAILSSAGFNRFNNDEAIANAPADMKSQLNAELSKWGVPLEGGSLNDVSRANLNAAAADKLNDISSRHQNLKQLAQNNYITSSFADPRKDIGGVLGAPTDQTLKALQEKIASAPYKKKPAATALASGPKQPQGGLAGFLKGAFGGATNQAAPQADPAEAAAKARMQELMLKSQGQ